jgi:hypothetical protein
MLKEALTPASRLLMGSAVKQRVAGALPARMTIRRER